MASLLSAQCRWNITPLIYPQRWPFIPKNGRSLSSQAGTSSTYSTSTSSSSSEVKPLSKPLGVLDRPSIKHKTRAQRLKDVLTNDEAIAEQRKHLVKEAVTKGYFHDLNATRWNGGKTWIAPKVLIREDRSLYLPDIEGKALSDGIVKHTTTMCLGRISLLCMLGTKISEVHTAGFSTPTLEQYSSHPLFQHIQINLQENVLKSMLVSLFLSSLRRVIPTNQQPNYLVSSQNLEYEREAMGFTNSRVGYVYLVDENLRIRWAGCADATLEEAKSLEVCTGILLQRLEKREKEKEAQAKRIKTELEEKQNSSE